MRVLVACESSGRVRDAFLARGHRAVSCDVLPTEVPGPHIHGDVFSDGVLVGQLGENRWDLMLAFPPCTYLTTQNAPRWAEIAAQRSEALDFVRALLNAPIPKICLENPKGAIGTHIRKADQYVHPWWFGEPYQKMTGLWLKNLPKLVPDVLTRPPDTSPWVQGTYGGRVQGVHRLSKDRSRTFQGIANAMAAQWG